MIAMFTVDVKLCIRVDFYNRNLYLDCSSDFLFKTNKKLFWTPNGWKGQSNCRVLLSDSDRFVMIITTARACMDDAKTERTASGYTSARSTWEGHVSVPDHMISMSPNLKRHCRTEVFPLTWWHLWRPYTQTSRPYGPGLKSEHQKMVERVRDRHLMMLVLTLMCPEWTEDQPPGICSPLKVICIERTRLQGQCRELFWWSYSHQSSLYTGDWKLRDEEECIEQISWV